MKKGFIWIVFLFAIFSLSACTAKEKEFSGSGITITLDTTFVEKDTVQVPFYLVSLDHIFMGMRETKSSLTSYGISSLSSYMDGVLSNGGKSSAEVLSYDEDGVSFLYAYYTNSVDGVEYGYMLVAMEGSSHYYSMNFGCLSKDLEDSKDQYLEWAQGIIVE